MIFLYISEPLAARKVYCFGTSGQYLSTPGIIINNPESTLMRTYIKLVTKQIYNFGIVNYLQSLVHLFSTSAQTVQFSSRVGTGMALYTEYGRILKEIKEIFRTKLLQFYDQIDN